MSPKRVLNRSVIAQAKGERRRRCLQVAEGRPDCRKVDQSSTGQSGVQEMVDKPCSGLGRAVRRRELYPRFMESNRCGKMHSKCKVQTLYSPGIAQDCVVTVNKVRNTK